MFNDTFTKGKDIPYCQVWIKNRSGRPIMVGDSVLKTGFFKKNDPLENTLTSVSVSLEDKKPNSAAITFIDTMGVLDQGMHAGIPIYIKMGYSSQPGTISGFGEPKSKLLFAGTMQRPSVAFNQDGTIAVSIKAKDKTDKMRYEKYAKTYQQMPRIAIVQQILSKYLDVLSGTVTKFENMNQMETRLSTPRMTDLERLYYLAARWGCTFDTRVNEATGTLMGFFVDDNDDGDETMGTMDPSLSGKPAYKMEWRDGLRNLKSIKFGGEASSNNSKGGILRRADDGTQEVVENTVGATDPDDPSNWELDQSRVDAWLDAHPNSDIADFRRITSTWPLPRLHAAFYRQKAVQIGGTPQRSTAPDSQNPGLGGTGYKCEFELTRGDAFLCANTPVELGGHVYGQFMSRPNRGVFSVQVGNQVRTFRDGDVLYWRASKITHTFDSNGFHTKGTLKR